MKQSELRSYILGFTLSLTLTVTAYLLVSLGRVATNPALLLIAALALVQFVVQLVYFLHITPESKPRWKLLVFGFMLLVVTILVLGSLWIMYNLDYNHVHPMTEPVNNYLHSQDGL